MAGKLAEQSRVVRVLKFDSLQSDHNLQAASDKFEVLTYNGVISSAIASAAIAGIGLVFFALFI